MYKDKPLQLMAQLENQSMMQLFGGKTGGKPIESAMKGLGLTVEKQERRNKVLMLRKRNLALQAIKESNRTLAAKVDE